jgi:hypothetical protein
MEPVTVPSSDTSMDLRSSFFSSFPAVQCVVDDQPAERAVVSRDGFGRGPTGTAVVHVLDQVVDRLHVDDGHLIRPG